MTDIKLNKKIINASKWSGLTEIIAKLIVPITNMILARIISPEAFGVVATVNMVISFTDMFTDAGFQKYIVQNEFKTDTEKINHINVAFWTNIAISMILFIAILLFNKEIADALGNPELGNVIMFASVQLPITSFSSIQMAVYRREFDFKTLFMVRIISILLPFLITIPLAYIGFSYWSIIIGSTVGMLSNSIILTIKSKWKPRIYYDFNTLKEMFAFSMWSLIESFSIWVSTWVDIFIISKFLSDYQLGLYRTSINTVNSIMSVVTGAITPVLFSSLSRLQNEEEKFEEVFLKTQKIVALILLPIGVIVYLFSDLITVILLGNSWMEASSIIGIWGLVNCIKIVISNHFSELYRAKGKPKLSFLVQCIFLALYIPVCLISLTMSIKNLIITCIVGRLIIVIINLMIARRISNISAKKIVNNIITPIGCTLIISIIGIIMNSIKESLIWNIITIAVCIIVYASLVFVFMKKDVIHLLKNLNIRKSKNL